MLSCASMSAIVCKYSCKAPRAERSTYGEGCNYAILNHRHHFLVAVKRRRRRLSREELQRAPETVAEFNRTKRQSRRGRKPEFRKPQSHRAGLSFFDHGSVYCRGA